MLVGQSVPMDRLVGWQVGVRDEGLAHQWQIVVAVIMPLTLGSLKRLVLLYQPHPLADEQDQEHAHPVCHSALPLVLLVCNVSRQVVRACLQRLQERPGLLKAHGKPCVCGEPLGCQPQGLEGARMQCREGTKCLGDPCLKTGQLLNCQ